MRTQAKVGGEIGKNGYFYKGGMFLPSTDMPPGYWKINGKKVKIKKEQINPFQWEHQPTPFSKSIFPVINAWSIYQNRKLVLRDGIFDYEHQPITKDTIIKLGINGVFHGDGYPLGELIEMYNNGLIWIDINPEII